jgi:HAD superfamily hydrolase (TIGR01509 family)
MTVTLRLPIDAIICDMDGLLVDSEGLSADAWRLALAERGVTLTDADIDDMFGLRIDEDAALLIARYGLTATIDELVADKSARMAAMVATHLAPMPGAHELVEWLVTENVPHALATSGLGDYAVACLTTTGLLSAFPLRVSGEQVPHGKPAPDIFLEAARRLGIAPERCLVLEDAPHGVAAANAAGMRVIAVPNAFTAPLPCPPVTARMASLHEVLAHLRA